MTTATLTRPKTIHEIIPKTIWRDGVLVIGFALFTALMSQISIPLSFTPVPITGQTLAVLLSGAVLGPYLGASSQTLYVFLGAIGLPFYAEGTSGWSVLKAPSGGYLIGFIFASALVGYLSNKKNDRNVLSAIAAFVAGSIVIYTFGLIWLAHVLKIPMTAAVGKPSAIAYGLAPFVIGDVIKATMAGVLLPTSWKIVQKFDSKMKDEN
ncbi:MAG: biotin transporter BioY [Acidimicrobiia bacterium]